MHTLQIATEHLFFSEFLEFFYTLFEGPMIINKEHTKQR